MENLCAELRSPDGGSTQIVQLIVKTLSKVLRLQSLIVFKQCRKNLIKRGLEKNTILNRISDVNNIVDDLLSKPCCDRGEIFKFQYDVYFSLLTLENDSITKELKNLNVEACKQRRLLRSLVSESVFKICNDYLTSCKANDLVNMGARRWNCHGRKL